MTSVASPLPINPQGLTVLLGYYQDLGLFAGFDLQKHRTFTAGSPSVQIDLSAINEALQHGLSFKRKDNDEIAIGFRPDQFISYVLNAEELHRIGSEANVTDLLVKATEQEEIPENEINALAPDRRKIVEKVSRLSRDASFRRTVMSAYDNRCAITRTQLRLIDAAHILPVSSDESSDHVTNGVSLSPTYHRAYDNCLIYIDEDYVVRLNDEKVDELRANHLTGGFAGFCRPVGQRIHLPSDRSQYPNPDFIKLANRYRRIPGYT